MSLPAVMQHLQILEASGLVRYARSVRRFGEIAEEQDRARLALCYANRSSDLTRAFRISSSRLRAGAFVRSE